MNCSSETSHVNLTSVCVAIGESQVHQFIGQVRLRYVSFPSHSPNVTRMCLVQLRIINHSSLLGYRHKIKRGIPILPKTKNEPCYFYFVLILKMKIPFKEKTCSLCRCRTGLSLSNGTGNLSELKKNEATILNLVPVYLTFLPLSIKFLWVISSLPKTFLRA